jgi:hypothetical protein
MTAGKMIFFAKKNQKTLAHRATADQAALSGRLKLLVKTKS